MSERMAGGLGEHHAGELRRASAKFKAEHFVREELPHLGWRESDSARRHENDPEKLALAARRRTETTLSSKRSDERVGLGASKSPNGRLHAWMQGRPSPSALPQRAALGK